MVFLLPYLKKAETGSTACLSLLLIFVDLLCLSPLFLYLLPVRFGVNGIWAAFPAAQAVLAAVLGALLAWEHFIQEGYTPSVRMRVLLRKFRR